MNIVVTGDGNQVSVVLGEDVATGFSGFGHDLPTALENLAQDLRREPSEYEPRERARLRSEVRRMPQSINKIHLVD